MTWWRTITRACLRCAGIAIGAGSLGPRHIRAAATSAHASGRANLIALTIIELYQGGDVDSDGKTAVRKTAHLSTALGPFVQNLYFSTARMFCHDISAFANAQGRVAILAAHLISTI
jgi:hypothetical protein